MYKMQKNIVLQLLFLILPLSLAAGNGFGESVKINNNWKFTLSDVRNGESVDFNDSRWQNISLPHDWSVKGQLSPTLASCTGYLPGGIGWYRKTIDIPTDREGEKVYLYFEGVYNRSEVYLNGQLLGKRPNGYISFMYDATPYIKYGEENVIAVRLITVSMLTRAGIQDREYTVMWMVYANPVHIAQWGCLCIS